MSDRHFWQALSKPIIGLSPMDGISDHPFRHIQKKYGQPMLIYTEFTRVEALCLGRDARPLKRFLYDESQRPIIAQIYGCTPESFRQVAILLCQLGYDGIDINMGCPSKAVASGGSGAALIKEPLLAQEIIRATQLGVEQWRNGATVYDCSDLNALIVREAERRQSLLPIKYQERRPVPVTVKTRIGYDEVVVDEWIPTLLEMDLPAIALHGRTLMQRYTGVADWEQIGRAAEIARGSGTLILGNGDVKSLQVAHKRAADLALDGILIGRGSFGNPFVFIDDSVGLVSQPEPETVLRVALEHARLYVDTFSVYERYRFKPMRKHLGWYTEHLNWPKRDRTELRIRLQQVMNLDEVEEIILRQLGASVDAEPCQPQREELTPQLPQMQPA